MGKKQIELENKKLKEQIAAYSNQIRGLSFEINVIRNELYNKERQENFNKIELEEVARKDKLLALYKPIVHNSKMMAVNVLETVKMLVLEDKTANVIDIIDAEINRLKEN